VDNFDMRGVYDAVIVGTGLGGSTLAYRLGQRGLRVLVVERGDFLRPLTRKPDDPVGLSMASFRARGVSLPVGGQTKFYGAAMYRLRESDFRAIRHEAGESPAWPIAYSDLEPYYNEAEQLYRVHGASDGDPTEPPHSSGFPYPPIPHAPLVSRLIDNLRESGTSVSSTPRALDYGAGGKCILCPTCDSYYCQLDAKMDAEIAALRPAIANSNVKLLTRATCLRILTTENGSKTTGVLIEVEGQQQTIHADIVVVCAGFLNSARLLIDSRCSRHPHGLGNSTGCVGRYYGGHTTGLIFPLLSMARKLPPMHTKTFSINSYYLGASDWPYPMGVIQAAGQIPFWEASIDKFTSERSICVFHMTEALPTRESGFEFHEGSIAGVTPPVENLVTFNRLRRLAIDVFRNAGYLVKSLDRRYLWHRIGTVRFGLDPNSSVLDANCKVHDLGNLYVVDASVLPSAGAINTGLTISALALRVGDIIAGCHSHNSKRLNETLN
jgi:choline dehydrogenase-like flavoprotein